MPHGGTIRIAARNVELDEKSNVLLPSGRYLKIVITDRGNGVAEELTTKIFDPYFTTKPDASGLGLAISYSIIKKHGGLLHLETTSHEGSSFAFYLPATDETETATTSVEPKSRPVRFNHPRVLVMDDEPAIRELTSQLLGTLGYEVTGAPDGMEAIRIYERALHRGEQFHALGRRQLTARRNDAFLMSGRRVQRLYKV
jgi:CheY-like chemotaxis protein